MKGESEPPAPAPSGPSPDRAWLNADRIFFSLLVVSLPLAIVAHYAEWSGPVTFILCAVALIPLARLMGTATEVIAHHVGPGLGGKASVVSVIEKTGA